MCLLVGNNDVALAYCHKHSFLITIHYSSVNSSLESILLVSLLTISLYNTRYNRIERRWHSINLCLQIIICASAYSIVSNLVNYESMQ